MKEKQNTYLIMREKLIQLLKERKADQLPGHTAGEGAWHYFVEKLAVPGPRETFAWRYADLAVAMQRLADKGIVRLEGSALNPNIYYQEKADVPNP